MNMNMKMQMQKKFFAGIFVGALFSAAIFAGEARAQGTPSNLLLTPEPGSESTALRLTWTQPSGEIERQILDVRQSGGTWGNDVFFSTLPSGVVASNTLGSGNFLYIDPAVSQTTLSNLSPDTTYEARVRIRNSSGTGAWSGAVRRATLAAGTVAGTPPGNLSYEQVSGSESYQIRLSWTAGTAPSGATAQHQSIAIRRPGDAWPNPSAKDNQLPHGASWTGRTTAGDEHQIHPAATGGNIINLRAATTFELRVRLWYQVAGQPEAAGGWSDVLQVETGEAVFGVTPPTGLTFTPTPGEEGFSGRLHWTNGRAIASRQTDRYIQLHTISMRVSGEDWPEDSLFNTLVPGVKLDTQTTGTPREIDPDETTALIKRMEPDTAYELRMRSLDGGSETGDWSQVLRFTTGSGTKEITPPTGLRVTPTRDAEAYSVGLNWTRGTGPIAFQTMSVRPLGEDWPAARSHNGLPMVMDDRVTQETPLDAHEGPDDDDDRSTKTIHRLETSARLRRLEPATTYQVRMNSVSEDQVSEWSAVVQFATASGDRLPDTNGGVTPAYDFRYTPTRGAESTSGRVDWTIGTPVGYRFRDDDIQYHSLVLRDIDEEWEELVGFVIVPDGVTWDARRGEDAREIHPDETSVVFHGLEPATTYQMRLESVDIGSTPGPLSEVFQFVTESMDNILAILTPRVVTADPSQKMWDMELQWRLPEGAPAATAHHVRWRAAEIAADFDAGIIGSAAGAWQNASGDDADCAAGAANPENCGEALAASASTYMVENLPLDAIYEFEVRTASAGNTGEWSETLSFTVESLPTDATLSALTASDVDGGVTLTPAFDPETLTYAAEVISSTLDFGLAPTSTDPEARIKIAHGTAAAKDAGGGAVVWHNLDQSGGANRQGPERNTFYITVTAQDGIAKQTYEVAVTRLVGDNNATLSALTITSGSEIPLSPPFNPAVRAYTAEARNHRTGLLLNATAADPDGATLRFNKLGAMPVDVNSGENVSVSIDRSSGIAAQDASANTMLIEVTADDQSTVLTYQIAMSRAAAATDTSLSALSVGSGTLSPAFDTGVTSYYLAVGNNVAQLAITPTATDSAAGLQLGRFGFLGPASTVQGVEIGRGNNVFLVVVTAEDGMTTGTYTVDVFRGGAVTKMLFHDAAETSRTDANSLLPTANFAQTVPAYSLSADNTVDEVVITITLTAGGASYQRIRPTVTPASATALTSNTASDPIPLAGGENLILVKVDVAEYPVTITRPPLTPNVSVSGRSQKLRVSWDAGHGVDEYRVRWRAKGSSAWRSARRADNNGEAVEPSVAPEYTINGLTNGTTYQVQARADNAALGNSEWSASVEAAPRVTVELPPVDDLAFVAGDIASVVTLPNAAEGTAPYVFSVTGLPPGVFFSPATRQISGMPTTPAAPVEVVYSVTDSASSAGSDERRFRVGILDSHLNVAEDGADGATPADGIIIARYLLGVRGAALGQGQSELDAERLEAAVESGVRGLELDADGDGSVDGDDGILIARYLLGLRGAELTNGISGRPTASTVESTLSDLLP